MGDVEFVSILAHDGWLDLRRTGDDGDEFEICRHFGFSDADLFDFQGSRITLPFKLTPTSDCLPSRFHGFHANPMTGRILSQGYIL